VFVIYGFEGNVYKGAFHFLVAGLLIWIGVGAARLARPRLMRSAAAPDSPRWEFDATYRWMIASLLLATLTWPVIATRHSRTCWHDQRWYNSIFGIAHSTNGGPCGNGPGAPIGRPWHMGGGWYLY